MDAKSVIVEHPMLSKVSAAAGQANVVSIRGYVGRSILEGHVRIYPRIDDLSDSIEIANADIIYAASAPESMMPYGGTIIWVRRDANVIYTHVDTVRMPAHLVPRMFGQREWMGGFGPAYGGAYWSGGIPNVGGVFGQTGGAFGGGYSPFGVGAYSPYGSAGYSPIFAGGMYGGAVSPYSSGAYGAFTPPFGSWAAPYAATHIGEWQAFSPWQRQATPYEISPWSAAGQYGIQFPYTADPRSVSYLASQWMGPQSSGVAGGAFSQGAFSPFSVSAYSPEMTRYWQNVPEFSREHVLLGRMRGPFGI